MPAFWQKPEIEKEQKLKRDTSEEDRIFRSEAPPAASAQMKDHFQSQKNSTFRNLYTNILDLLFSTALEFEFHVLLFIEWILLLHCLKRVIQPMWFHESPNFK